MRKEASLSIIEDTKNNKFLMIRHHRGVNKGYINFPGGKKEPNETMLDCVCRETLEETGLVIKNPKEVGYVEFPTMDFYVHIYWSKEFEGNIHEKADEVELFWQPEDEIPYDQMRDADRDFLPQILAGKYVKKAYYYDKDFHVEKIIDL